MHGPSDVTGPWIDRDDAGGDVRLFCFAHAGGGGAIFRPWRKMLAPALAVTPVILPGREARWREAPYVRMEALLGPLCDAVQAAVAGPFAFFGHSLGAAVAYEAALRLATARCGPPRCLLVSARRAPHLPSRRSPIHDLPTDRFLAELERLNGTAAILFRDPELLRALLPGLRADFELNDTYAPGRVAALPVPISAFVGNGDPLVNVGEMRRWGELTTSEFSLRVHDGDHFYLAGDRRPLLEAIRHDVARAMRLSGGEEAHWPS